MRRRDWGNVVKIMHVKIMHVKIMHPDPQHSLAS